MKINTTEQHVHGSHGLQQTQAFRIRASAHAFKMLSSGLYSDKVSAVLREIGCNAFDAHVMQGTPDRPIEVKLPNRIDSQFYIRDWGPGLPHDEVMGLYTTYFESTKQSSNDYTGAFGLGSKSPFSYVDSFTVTSVNGGKKRTYSAHLDNTGAPTIALLTTEDADADWPHGLMVGFPIRPADYSEFQTKARTVYQWFRVLPKIEGAQAVQPPEVTRDAGEFFHLKYFQGTGVVMGNVFYPLDAGQINGLTQLARWAFTFYGTVLRVPIGEVEVAASRETLQYSDDTCKTLVRRLEHVTRTVAADVASRLRKFASADWEERCRTRDVETEWSTGYVDWGGVFRSCSMPDAEELLRTMRNRTVELPPAAGQQAMCRIFTPMHNLKVSHKVVRDGKVRRGDEMEVASVALREKTVIYHGDAPHAMARARSLILVGDAHQVILLTPDAKRGSTAKEAKREAATIAKIMKGVPVKDIGGVPVPPDALAKKGTGKKRAAKLGISTPLPKMDIDILQPDGKKGVVDVSTLGKDDWHYMCQTPHWNYSGVNGIRLFSKHIDTDKAFEHRTWIAAWSAFVELGRLTGLGKTSVMLFPTAMQIRQLDLPKRGWKSTYQVIKEWTEDKDVRDAVAHLAAKWRPSVSVARHTDSYVSLLVYLRGNEPAAYAEIEPVLASSPLKLDVAIRELHEESKKAGSSAGAATPPAVALYTRLASFVGAAPIAASGSRNYLTPQDLDAKIDATHPVASSLHPGRLTDVMREAPKHLAAFARVMFST